MPEYNFVTEQIFTVDGFFTAAECDACIAYGEELGFADAPITTARGPVMRKDVRNNERVMFDDQRRADDLWQRITDYIPLQIGPWTACGLNERFRMYRYDEGQQFDWHRDGYFERENGERSQLTFMVYLNEDFSGGETTVDGNIVMPQQGTALFFVHRLLHKGQPVTTGRKYVLRSDVMYRKVPE